MANNNSKKSTKKKAVKKENIEKTKKVFGYHGLYYV